MFAYSEDADLCLRLRDWGKRTRVVARAEVRHICNATSNLPELAPQKRLAAARNNRVLRSRRGRWLRTRRPEDAPKPVLNDLERLACQIEGFPGETVNCVIATEPMSGRTDLPAVVADAAALSHLRPTAIAGPEPIAVLDICFWARSIGQAHDRLTSAATEDVRDHDIDVMVVISDALSLPPLVRARRRISHLKFSARPSDLPPEARFKGLGALLNFDAIVTDSDFSRRAWQRILQDIGAPQLAIEVIPGPADLVDIEDPAPARANMIISHGPLRSGPAGGGHEAAVRAFRQFCGARRSQKWRLVIVGDLAPGDNPDYLGRLEASRKSLDVDVLIAPPRPVLHRLLVRSKIYLSAQGLGAEPIEGALSCTQTMVNVGAAISAGCVPVVFGVGAEAEFCEAEGVGFQFEDEPGLWAALERAASSADDEGMPAASRARMAAFSSKAHAKRWADLVSSLEANETRRAATRAANRERSRGQAPVKAIVVLGSHRSGTSAMAGALSIAGADLPNEVMAPKHDNPTGFWEPKPIADWNDRFLASAGSQWHDPRSYFGRSWFAELGRGRTDELVDLLGANYPGDRPIVLKDPRISLLTPIWDAALREAGYEPAYVLMVRDPREVAASLSARDDFPFALGLAIWASYMLAAETDTRGARRAIVSYDDLLTAPERVVAGVEAALETSLVPRQTRRRDYSHFIDAGRRSQSFEEPWDEPEAQPLRDYYLHLLDAGRPGPAARLPSEALLAWLGSNLSVLPDFRARAWRRCGPGELGAR